MKKKVLIVLLVVALAGYAGYCALAQYKFSQGRAAFEAKDWLKARENFEQVGTFYKLALPSHSEEMPIWSDQSSLLLFGKTMSERGDYESALDAYTSLIVLYPGTEVASSIKELIPAIYMDWGNSLRDNSDFAGAIEKFDIVIQEYPQTPAGDLARVAKSETYLSWANQLRNSNQHELALETYNFIIANVGDTPAATEAAAALAPTLSEWTRFLHQNKQFSKEVELLQKLITDYKNTNEAQQASQEIIAAYDSLGRQLMADRSFFLSMQAYNDAREFALDEDAKNLLDAGYKDAIQGLAKDTGKNGIQVISDTLDTACAGRPALSPTVGTLKNTPGKAMLCRNSSLATVLSIPTEYKPTMPGEFKYVVYIEEYADMFLPCLYTGGVTGATKRKVAEITVYSTVTGSVVDSHIFKGAIISCPQYSNGPFETTYNELHNEIFNWLEDIFKG
jgi:tetratricopeptide (TPR) repeat protein